MDRRDFLKSGAAGGLLAALPSVGCCAQPPTAARIIPEDKGLSPEFLASLRERGARRVYRGPARAALGMPCGGICAGQLYVLSDGTLGGWHIDGRLNGTGYGSESYKPRRIPREIEQGFSINVEGENRVLSTHPIHHVERAGTFDDIGFVGEYPLATVTYSQSAALKAVLREGPCPIEPTLRIGSPFIPLNAKDSALPCTLMRWTLKNTSGEKVRGFLTGRLQNGVESRADDEIHPIRRNRVVRAGDLTAVLMDAMPTPRAANAAAPRVLFDFEKAPLEGWARNGTAFTQGAARGARAHQQPVSGFLGSSFVTSFIAAADVVAGDAAKGTLTSPEFQIDRRFMTLLVGGGGHAGQTCVNLLIDGAAVRTATGKNNEKLEPRAWDLKEFQGRSARLQVVDNVAGPWGHIALDHVQLTDEIDAEFQGTTPTSLGHGTMAIAYFGHAGATAHISTAPDPRRGGLPTGSDLWQSEGPVEKSPIAHIHVPFELAPGEEKEFTFTIAWCFPNLHTGQGVMYSNWFEDAMAVCRYVQQNLARLTRDTALFHQTYYEESTLPWWLSLRLMMPTSNLATGTAQWWKNGRFWGWEGVGCCHGTCTHVWNYSHAEARLFPELARSNRVMQDLGAGFEESTGRVAFRGEVNGGFEYAGDGQAGTVLKCYREHLCSPDDTFLKQNWPRIKQVLAFLLQKDAEERAEKPAGSPDGIMRSTQHNTFDINFEGPNTFVGSLYLAALLAGARMAEHVGDAEIASLYARVYAQGRAYTEKNLFKHGYFIQEIPADAKDQWQYGEGCLTDQTFGQTWARLLSLGTVYREDLVASALKSIFKYNWAPVIGDFNAKFPPERFFAEGRDAGLVVCTWPAGKRPGEPVRYRDEVWTGCEYQAATGMIAEGLVDEALAIINAIEDRYDGRLRNPWNEVECGDHYARAMASWGAFQALCGFEYDGPAGTIGLAPRLSPEKFAAFFSAAEGWGLASQTRSSNGQRVAFEVKWGSLKVSRLLASLPDAARDAKLEVRAAGAVIAAVPERTGLRAVATLSQPILVEAGQTIEAAWTW